MTTPYEPATLFLDTLPLVEFIMGTGPIFAWPGDNVLLSSTIYDTADMLPARRQTGPTTADTFMAGGGGLSAPPDPRFFVDWFMALEFAPSGAATDPMVVMSILGTVGADFNNFALFDATCHGSGATIRQGPHGGAAGVLSNQPMSGSVRVTCRTVQVIFHTFGTTAPSNCGFGAYLRVL